MGTNRRYADRIDAQMDARILQRIAEDAPLQSLTDEELELGRLPLTIDPKPQACRVWVRFGARPVRVDAVAVRWTSCAIGVAFKMGERELRTWVWASAVERS